MDSRVSAEQILNHFLDRLCQEVPAWNQGRHDFLHPLEPEGAHKRQAPAPTPRRARHSEEGGGTYVASPMVFLKLWTRRT